MLKIADGLDAELEPYWVTFVDANPCCIEAASPESANEQAAMLGGMVSLKLPHLGNGGTGAEECLSDLTSGTASRSSTLAYMRQLAERLRRTRVCCGDWSRVLGPSVTFKHGITGVFLDPPYADTAGRQSDLYATDSETVAHQVLEWAIANGDNPLLRIALCGYEGEHTLPDSWEFLAWKARGGYGSQGDGAGRANSNRERIWFSPHCLKIPTLFSMLAGVEMPTSKEARRDWVMSVEEEQGAAPTISGEQVEMF